MFSTSMKDFKIEKILGKGSFGSVYLVTRKEDQKIYALKSVFMEKLNKKEQENSVNEVRILASVNHPNVIGYKETFWDDQTNTLNIVMEYADDGDLQTKIQKMKKNLGLFDEQLIWSYSIQMIEGLKALHDKKIMHRDLKSANIFLIKNKRQCKIGDMNVSKVIKEKVLRTQTGTPYYASPEVWNDKPYSYKSDLWSIGCVIYELCALRPPFKGKDLDELYINVCKGKVERINKIYSDSLWKMILLLLQVDVNKRVNCDQFLNHPLIIRKIKEMKEKNIDFKDLEENKNTNDGFLLNTINFKNLREIKSQLPTRKNYESNQNNNNINKSDKIYNINNYSSFDIKKYGINNNGITNYKDYYLYLNNNINNILNNNNNHIYKFSNIETNNNYNKINHKNINNGSKNNYNDIINIINDKSLSNNNNDILNKIKQQYNSNNLSNSNHKINIVNDSLNLNYNKYDRVFHTDVGEMLTGADRISLLRNERCKLKMSSGIDSNYEKMNTEEKINNNEKIIKLKKEKHKIIEKQKENNSKTIEEEINNYKKLLNKINQRIDTAEPKYNNYLSIINSGNNKKYEKNRNRNEKELINKNEKFEDKYNKLLNNINSNSYNNNQIIKNKKNIIDIPGSILKIDNLNKSNELKMISSSSRINKDYNFPITKINNYNNLHNNKYEIKSISKPFLNKKNQSYNNIAQRSKTPSLNYYQLSKNIDNNNKKKDKSNKKIYDNSNNILHKSLINQISTDNISSIGKQNYIENIKNNINSTEINPRVNNNNIKRINKRIITFNKKNKNNNKNNNNTNISKNRQTSSIPINKMNKNIIINNNLNIYDINNISHQYLNNPINYINYDFNKYLNNVNLTNININENNGRKSKNNLNEKTKTSINKDLNNNPHRYSANNIKISKTNNKKNTNNSDNNNIKKKGHKQNNSFNFINPSSTTNKNSSILQNAKKLNVRSNSYRMSGHEKNYISKKRELNYRYDLTEPEGRISSNFLKMKNKKINTDPKLSNLSLFSSGLDFLGISSTSNGNTFLQNIKTNNDVNNHLANINKINKLSGRYYLNIQNMPKCPQIFNNYYSINGISSNLPIKVINVFNNK